MTAGEQHPEDIDRLIEHRMQSERRTSKRRSGQNSPLPGISERRQKERRQNIRRTEDFPLPSQETSDGAEICPGCGAEFFRLSPQDAVKCPGCGQKLL